MKTGFQLMQCEAVSVFVILGFVLQACASAAESDGPRQAFSTLRNALVQNVKLEVEHLLAEIPKATTKEEIATMYLDAFQQFQQGTRIEEVTRFADWFILLRDGEVDWVEMFSGTYSPEWNATNLARVWLMSKDRKLRGFIDFIEQKGQWKWLPPIDPDAPTAPAYSYDITTPTKAFATLKRAQDPGYDGMPDLHGIHYALENSLKSSLPALKYREVIGGRKGKAKWTRPDFSYGADRLEEEMPPLEDGKQKCRVWRLDEKGKRTTFELFVKEGDEWKWLPDPKCIWYPAKTEADPKE